FAVASAQAADLPVKAKPVEYVKVCSLYGAGFFYVPGTDTCLKIGMYIRSDHGYGAGAVSAPPGYYIGTSNSLFTRDATSFYSYRARINLTTDWRTQSDYGVIRAYAAIIAQDSNTDAASTGVAGILRAFIQFAGFTAGHAVSYFDFFNGADYGYAPSIWGQSTGVNGTDLIAYTWQFGNGWSASVDIEDGGNGVGGARTKRVINVSNAGDFTIGAGGPNFVGATQAAITPDIAANIRVDQAWGSAQLSGALHQLGGSYYTAGQVPGSALTSNGHPNDTWGWAIQGGFRLLNFLQPKDRFEASAYWCDGATAYCVSTPIAAPYGSGNTLGVGYAVDGVFVNGSGIEKTEAWGFQAAYEHFWNAQWRTAVVGGYTAINYNQTATNMICGVAGSGGLNQFAGTAFGATGVCSPDFSQTSVSTRTAWNPHPTLEIGLDLIWWHLNTANSGVAVLASNGARFAGPYTYEDQDRYLAILRIQKTVLP
ncbi:MAG: porin, partial [Xanthobacteraceae bacterium]